ncbi:hypothetical protein PFICI_09968 [Pestalotiopsis fici W106-1]|uniref:Uncharacterized protein n=1 Tax=Pestalotiopsis fici (strain W106-1 / CGMCC3.15140) TaxID=1229662 RepID=W3WYE1_PESFW|nr:uncharacterized protein PFICI_09968 [Pestalotiopsis fici W106-1]ETS77906.1 hypothetical protein PFICI_09968 [Pestalotiopsis fici W106-1]
MNPVSTPPSAQVLHHIILHGQTNSRSSEASTLGGVRTWFNPAGMYYEDNKWTTERAIQIEFYTILAVIIFSLILGCITSCKIMHCFSPSHWVRFRAAEIDAQMQEAYKAAKDREIAKAQEEKQTGIRSGKYR